MEEEEIDKLNDPHEEAGFYAGFFILYTSHE